MPRQHDHIDLDAPGGPNIFGIERKVYDVLASAGRPLSPVEIVSGVRGTDDGRGVTWVRRWISQLRAALVYSARETIETTGRNEDLRYALVPVIGALQDPVSRAARRDAELLRLDGDCQSPTRITQALGFESVEAMTARLMELRAERQARKAAGLPLAPGGADLPTCVGGKPGSHKAAIVAGIRAAGGAFVPAIDLVHAAYGTVDPAELPGRLATMKALINEARVGIRTRNVPAEIPSEGRAETLAYAWRDLAEPAPSAMPEPEPAGTVEAEERSTGGSERVWISLAPRGTFFDGDSIIDRDGQKRPRARAA